MKIKVLFLTNLPSPYMVSFFNEFGKKCSLTVVFERSFSSERNGRWDHYHFENFKAVLLKGIHTSPDSALSVGVCKYLNACYDSIIVANPMTPTGILAIEYMRLKKISYIIESEGSFPKNGKGIKERFKRHIISGAKAYFSTTERADKYFLAYGAKKNRIYHYPFTSLYEQDLLEVPLTQEEKTDLRRQKNLLGRRIAVAAGRLIPLKRFDDLIRAWSEMPSEWYLYILGEGEERKRLKKLARDHHLSNVLFPGYKEKEELRVFYQAADLFIHPTSTDVWGLVVNEAMSCGLPVITTDMCIAGDALVKNGENGYRIPVGNIHALAEKTKRIMGNEEILRVMAGKSIEKISPYTFENMAKVHIKLLKNLHRDDKWQRG